MAVGPTLVASIRFMVILSVPNEASVGGASEVFVASFVLSALSLAIPSFVAHCPLAFPGLLFTFKLLASRFLSISATLTPALMALVRAK